MLQYLTGKGDDSVNALAVCRGILDHEQSL